MRSVSDSENLDQWFLSESHSSHDALKRAVNLTLSGLIEDYASQEKVYSGIDHTDLKTKLEATPFASSKGLSIETVQQQVNELVLKHSLNLGHKQCMAHLHCPPLIPAVAAELSVAAMNQSMDSWDQSPAASVMEQFVCDWLCGQFGFSEGDATFTSGGTQSNFMGMLLARNKLVRNRLNIDCQKVGLPNEAMHYRVFCSDIAHFSIKQSMSLLGLGSDSVIGVKTDAMQNLDVADLKQKIEQEKSLGHIPMAICATAGTTDFASIDPLQDISEVAALENIWLHVDAAYGGVLQVLPGYKQRLKGIELADSVTVDFHKMFYQPISSSAFLIKNTQDFTLIQLNADYLNPVEDEVIGLPNLVGKSIQTTRRFDALKLYMSLQHIGIDGLEMIVSHTIRLAKQAAEIIKHDERFELACEPSLNAVVFRWKADAGLSENVVDDYNQQASQSLIMQGVANIAKTRIKDRAWLKLTLLNPQSKVENILAVLESIDVCISGLKDVSMEACA